MSKLSKYKTANGIIGAIVLVVQLKTQGYL